jgi:hypothetical protein
MADEQECRVVRLALRKLLDRYPDAFVSVMRDMISNDEHWQKLLPPRDDKRITPTTLAMLLADYRNAKKLKYTREEFLARSAEEGCAWGGPYHGGTWENEETIKSHLTEAEARAKKDIAFNADVDFYEWAMESVGCGSMNWGQKG